MTEEALKDEICEYVHNIYKTEPFNGFSYRDLRDIAEHFALPREKQIEELNEELHRQVLLRREDIKKGKEWYNKGEELEAQITTLSQNLDDAMSVENALKKRIEELETQIEKMKCCNNCKYRCYMDWKSKCCFDMTKIRDIENPVTCKCDKWEIER